MAQIFVFLSCLLGSLFSSIICLNDFLSCLSRYLLLTSSSFLTGRASVHLWRSTRMWNLAKHHSWTLRLRAYPNVVLIPNSWLSDIPTGSTSPLSCFQRHDILWQRSDFLIGVPLLLGASGTTAILPVNGFLGRLAKCLRPWMQRRFWSCGFEHHL